MTEAIYDIDDEGARMTLAETFTAFGIDWNDPDSHRIAALGPQDSTEIDMGAHGIFVVRRVS